MNRLGLAAVFLAALCHAAAAGEISSASAISAVSPVNRTVLRRDVDPATTLTARFGRSSLSASRRSSAALAAPLSGAARTLTAR